MTGKTYTINPVTRIEGNARITLYTDGNTVTDAHFHVTEFKGFEKYLEGRMVHETPRITTRACGICPVSHHLAAAKAVDDLFKVKIPKPAELLRELMHMGQYIQSHALHFFFLAAPDLLLGPDSPPAEKNFLGLLKEDKDLVKIALKMRAVGQDTIQTIGGKAVHPVAAVPGGMSHPLVEEDKEKLLFRMREILPLAEKSLMKCTEVTANLDDIIQLDSETKTAYLGMIKRDGSINLYSGVLRLTGIDGRIYEEFNPSAFDRYIAEKTTDYSYLKLPYYKPLGWPNGIYRVGPLARLNAGDNFPTDKAGAAVKDFREKYGRPAHQTFLYHQARMIELLYACERAIEILEDPLTISTDVHEPVQVKAGDGIGIVEAPRGTLIHYYKADNTGRILKANLIVATVQNNPGINQSIKQVAESALKRGIPEEGLLNRVEMVVRAYDPCLTCAAHVAGRIPLEISIVDKNGSKRILSGK